MKKTDRKEVYEAIDLERDYQDGKWGSTRSNKTPLKENEPNRTLDEYVLYISGYADQLKSISCISTDKENKLDFIRKIAALSVSAMEEHGIKHRKND